jgi:predicted RNA-binding Zn ribbon-like protein
MSHWLATERYALSAAPGGLAFVQDFLNTRAIKDSADLLADGRAAQKWAKRAVRAWTAERRLSAHPLLLTDRDAARLRRVRDRLDDVITGDAPPTANAGSVAVALTLDGTNDVQWAPTGQGWRWLCSALYGEMLLSQHTGSWARLKQCHNSVCRSAFYDRSKNVSGVWHDVKTCGNAANLRASRARSRLKRTAELQGKSKR